MENPSSTRLYYDQLKKSVSHDPDLPYIVQNAHKVFITLTLLIQEPDLPAHLRSKCFCALGYFFIPDDVFPEEVHGAIGYVEDVLISIFVFKQVIIEMGDDGKIIVDQLLAENKINKSLLFKNFELEKENYKDFYFAALYKTGLIHNDEHEAQIITNN